MTADRSDEQLDCAIEASDLLKRLDRYAAFDEQEITRILRSSKFCSELSQEELAVVAAYIHGLLPSTPLLERRSLI